MKRCLAISMPARKTCFVSSFLPSSQSEKQTICYGTHESNSHDSFFPCALQLNQDLCSMEQWYVGFKTAPPRLASKCPSPVTLSNRSLFSNGVATPKMRGHSMAKWQVSIASAGRVMVLIGVKRAFLPTLSPMQLQMELFLGLGQHLHRGGQWLHRGEVRWQHKGVPSSP